MYFPFLSLSLSLSSLCCVIYYPRGRSSVHSSKTPKRVTTGPNGLKRVPSQRVPTGSNGGRGGEERSMTRLLSPHNNIIHIIYTKKKFYFSIHISSLSLSNNPQKIFIYKKKFLYLFIYVYLFIYL